VYCATSCAPLPIGVNKQSHRIKTLNAIDPVHQINTSLPTNQTQTNVKQILDFVNKKTNRCNNICQSCMIDNGAASPIINIAIIISTQQQYHYIANINLHRHDNNNINKHINNHLEHYISNG
jgi:hypothetical protein